MPIQINGESVPDALVDEELARLLKSSRSSDKTLDEAGMQKFRLMAACGVVDRILIRQAAEKDTRPIAPDVVDAEMQAEMNRSNCRPGVNEEAMPRKAEQDLRLRRTMDELAGDYPRPTTDEVMQFFAAFKEKSGKVEKAVASHVVVHVNEQRGEEEARTLIEAAQAELERGIAFAEVAERFSDCKGNGGEIGSFERGVMVEEFEEAVFKLQPGGRTPIFRTPFGFHIAELHSKGHAEMREPGLAQREIEAYLTSMRRHQAMERGLEKLRDAAVIARLGEATGV
jgi:peptidyl-prolyl cis-trans isomerase C